LKISVSFLFYFYLLTDLFIILFIIEADSH
jgi:hypothetical protein